MTPGKPAHPAAVKAAQEWAELEEQEEIAEALVQDAKDSVLDIVNDTCIEDNSPSEDELDELDEGFESPEEVSLMAPPPYTDISSLFEQLEQYAELCGIAEAGLSIFARQRCPFWQRIPLGRSKAGGHPRHVF